MSFFFFLSFFSLALHQVKSADLDAAPTTLWYLPGSSALLLVGDATTFNNAFPGGYAVVSKTGKYGAGHDTNPIFIEMDGYIICTWLNCNSETLFLLVKCIYLNCIADV